MYKFLISMLLTSDGLSLGSGVFFIRLLCRSERQNLLCFPAGAAAACTEPPPPPPCFWRCPQPEISRRPSAGSPQRPALSRQPSAALGSRPSAISPQQGALSRRPSGAACAVEGQGQGQAGAAAGSGARLVAGAVPGWWQEPRRLWLLAAHTIRLPNRHLWGAPRCSGVVLVFSLRLSFSFSAPCSIPLQWELVPFFINKLRSTSSHPIPSRFIGFMSFTQIRFLFFFNGISFLQFLLLSLCFTWFPDFEISVSIILATWNWT